MKKAIIASIITVMMAGASFAQGVTLSGTSKAGVVSMDDVVEFHQEVDVKFSMAGTMDNGLTFGSEIDLLDANTNAHSIWVSGPFGTVTLGDVDGAFDWALTEVDGGVGSLSNKHQMHAGWGWDGNGDMDGDTVLRYDNSFSGFGVAVSVAQPEISDTFGIGVTGSFVGADVGVGYQQTEMASIVGGSVAYEFAPVKGILNYSVKSKDEMEEDETHLGVGVVYTANLLSVGANYGKMGEDTGYGVAANYDLGGGAVAQFGYGSNTEVEDDSVWSAGVSLSF